MWGHFQTNYFFPLFHLHRLPDSAQHGGHLALQEHLQLQQWDHFGQLKYGQKII